jgi:hypothetical protein
MVMRRPPNRAESSDGRLLSSHGGTQLRRRRDTDPFKGTTRPAKPRIPPPTAPCQKRGRHHQTYTAQPGGRRSPSISRGKSHHHTRAAPPVSKTGRIWLNEAVCEVRAPPGGALHAGVCGQPRRRLPDTVLERLVGGLRQAPVARTSTVRGGSIERMRRGKGRGVRRPRIARQAALLTRSVRSRDCEPEAPIQASG